MRRAKARSSLVGKGLYFCERVGKSRFDPTACLQADQIVTELPLLYVTDQEPVRWLFGSGPMGAVEPRYPAFSGLREVLLQLPEFVQLIGASIIRIVAIKTVKRVTRVASARPG